MLLVHGQTGRQLAGGSRQLPLLLPTPPQVYPNGVGKVFYPLTSLESSTLVWYVEM